MKVADLTKEQFINFANNTLEFWKVDYDNGNIRWNVSNQHDFSRYKGAKKGLSLITESHWQAFIAKCGRVAPSFFTFNEICCWFSTYHAPELSSAWID